MIPRDPRFMAPLHIILTRHGPTVYSLCVIICLCNRNLCIFHYFYQRFCRIMTLSSNVTAIWCNICHWRWQFRAGQCFRLNLTRHFRFNMMHRSQLDLNQFFIQFNYRCKNLFRFDSHHSSPIPFKLKRVPRRSNFPEMIQQIDRGIL